MVRHVTRASQKNYIAAHVNLVEIDLLRGGEHTVAVPSASIPKSKNATQYVISFHRAIQPDQLEVYCWPLAQHIPAIRIP
jgi:hypothetical protein